MTQQDVTISRSNGLNRVEAGGFEGTMIAYPILRKTLGPSKTQHLQESQNKYDSRLVFTRKFGISFACCLCLFDRFVNAMTTKAVNFYE